LFVFRPGLRLRSDEQPNYPRWGEFQNGSLFLKRIAPQSHYSHESVVALAKNADRARSSSLSGTRPQGASRPRVWRASKRDRNSGMRRLKRTEWRGSALAQENAAHVAANKALRARPWWRGYSGKTSEGSTGAPKLNARTVEFIAKAGLGSELRDSIERTVFKFLDGQTGFAGAIVLTPHKEPRRIMVLSFWRTERDCRENEWEFVSEVQDKLGPLMDASSRVRTYNAELSQSLQTGQYVDAAQPC
jgi:hypothetical protein